MIAHLSLNLMLFPALLVAVATAAITATETGTRNHTVVVSNPHQPAAFSLKGQLHTHTTNSDGEVSPDAALQYWKERGYDFVAITDHDTYTDAAAAGLIIIPGQECSPDIGHFNIFGIASTFEECPDVKSTADVLAIATRVHKLGGLIQLNHGLRDRQWSATNVVNLVTSEVQIDGIEVINIDNEIDASVLWDTLLSRGVYLWGSAGNDMHTYPRSFKDDIWVCVATNENTPEGILAAIRDRNFYISQGPTITISIIAGAVVVKSANASTFEFIHQGQQVIQKTTGVTAAYTPNTNDKFVRVIVTDADGKKAWSQALPVTVKRCQPCRRTMSSTQVPCPKKSTGEIAPATGAGHRESNCTCSCRGCRCRCQCECGQHTIRLEPIGRSGVSTADVVVSSTTDAVTSSTMESSTADVVVSSTTDPVSSTMESSTADAVVSSTTDVAVSSTADPASSTTDPVPSTADASSTAEGEVPCECDQN